MTAYIRDNADVWAKIVEKHGLKSHDLRALIGQGDQHADFSFLYGAPAAPTIFVSTVKLRKAGFNAAVDTRDAFQGALVAYSGLKTGRPPKDKRVVKDPHSESEVWWGSVNIPLDPHAFAIKRERARDYLNTRERLYCFDGFAGWDPKNRIKVRVICSRPYHALFMHTMLIRPTKQELEAWARRIRASGAKRVWSYFNNDREGYAIKNARELIDLLQPPPMRRAR